jgi:hypothetical protein
LLRLRLRSWSLLIEPGHYGISSLDRPKSARTSAFPKDQEGEFRHIVDEYLTKTKGLWTLAPLPVAGTHRLAACAAWAIG